MIRRPRCARGQDLAEALWIPTFAGMTGLLVRPSHGSIYPNAGINRTHDPAPGANWFDRGGPICDDNVA